MKGWLQRLLFDWVFVLLYRLFQAFLNLVDFIESFFDVFAGTSKVVYKGTPDFLINVFFGHDAVTNAFWAMALIAIALAFGFCIVQLSRKVTDVTDSVKQSVGQIMSNFIRCFGIIIMINAVTVASINISNVLLDRINYAMENAAILNRAEEDKTFSEQEYATMTKILATVANYSVNPSADSRYNVNSCFNEIRPDLYSLYMNGFFDYDYPLDENGHYSWQGALTLLATSASLTEDLNLSTYYEDVVSAFEIVSKEISTYPDFAPVEKAHFTEATAMDTDVLIFLICGMEAAQNNLYNNGDFGDAIRKGYLTGEKSYDNLKQVRKDFDIWEIDYLVGYISCIVFVIIMAICIFTFIVRMFNLLLLYITAPLFASSMPIDDGSKWQSWTQAFVIQLFSGFGSIIAMRLYLIIIPIVVSSDLVFFAGNGLGAAMLNRMAQLLMVLGGAWAVLQSSGVITGILAGNPGMAAIQQEGAISGKVTGWAMKGASSALSATKKIGGGVIEAGKGLTPSAQRAAHAKTAEARQAKADRKRFKADSAMAQAERRMADGGSRASIDRAMNSAARNQKSADRAQHSADVHRAHAGQGVMPERSYHAAQSRKYSGFSGGGFGSDGTAAPHSVSGSAGGTGAAGSFGEDGGSGIPERNRPAPPPVDRPHPNSPYTFQDYEIEPFNASRPNPRSPYTVKDYEAKPFAGGAGSIHSKTETPSSDKQTGGSISRPPERNRFVPQPKWKGSGPASSSGDGTSSPSGASKHFRPDPKWKK